MRQVKWLADKILKLLGWRFTGEVPDLPRLVIVGAPHTSNWDFILFIAALHHYDMTVSFIGKHTLFRWPFGYFFRWLGGIPVDRSAPRGLVQQVITGLEAKEKAILVMAPEGTRSPAPFWKGGFLRIARGLEAPILFAGVDGNRKLLHIGPPVAAGDDDTEFMDHARAFFAEFNGLRPEGKGPVRLKAEA